MEAAEWAFEVTGAELRLIEGRLQPFVDLGAPFGGWWAPEAFDEPGKYHRPSNQPIPVTPPATPTEGPTQTPVPTRTPEPTATATEPPTPTDLPRPPGWVLLPWLGAR